MSKARIPSQTASRIPRTVPSDQVKPLHPKVKAAAALAFDYFEAGAIDGFQVTRDSKGNVYVKRFPKVVEV